MSDLDTLIKEKLVPMRKRIVETLLQKHPHLLGMVDRYMSGKNNKVAMRITENGAAVCDYTFYLNGINISDVKSGELSSELHPPMGVIKPYFIVERKTLETMLEDEQELINQPFKTSLKYFPDITIKFQK